MQGIHTLAQPRTCKGQKKTRNKLFQNCIKTQTKQRLQIGLNTPFQD